MQAVITSQIASPVRAEKVRPHPGTVNVRLKVGQVARQGDVLIRRVADTGLTEPAFTPRGRRDLAPGTAHSHCAEEPAQTYDAADGSIWIVSPAAFAVAHDTHRHFVLGAGTYRTWRQVEAAIVPSAASHAARYIRQRVRD